MGDDEIKSIQLHGSYFRESGPQQLSVGIAEHGGHGGERFELGQEIGWPDITSMENVVDLRKDLENPWPKQPVSVRDDSESHQGDRAAVGAGGRASFPSRVWKALSS